MKENDNSNEYKHNNENLVAVLEKKLNEVLNTHTTLDEFRTIQNGSSRQYREYIDNLNSIGRTEITTLLNELINTYNIVFNYGSRNKVLKGTSTLNSDSKPILNFFKIIDFNFVEFHISVEQNRDNELYFKLVESAISGSINKGKFKDEILIISDTTDTISPRYITDFEMITLVLKDQINIKTLQKNLGSIDKNIKDSEKNLEDLKEKRSDIKYVMDFMKSNKLTTEFVSTIKSKLILEKIKENDSEENELLTNFSEIISLDLINL